MSRWSILKDAIHGKSRSTNNLSIHRFDGFNFLAKKKAIWLGFELNIDQSMSVSEILETFHQFMSDVDSSECILVLESSGTNVSSTLQLIEECKLVSNFRIERISTSTRQSDRGELVPHVVARMYLTDDVLKPSLRSCEYWTYDLPSSNCLITREQQKNGKLNVNSLLSNKFVGVDNTGNVCVWPSEALLLYILLVEQQWKEIVRGKTVLELGGGMTSLAGIGIAASGLSSEVTVTDGHPDCVVNQVRTSLSK